MPALAVGLASAQLEGDEGGARVLPPETCEARNPVGFSGAAADVIYDTQKVNPLSFAGMKPCIQVTPEFTPVK